MNSASSDPVSLGKSGVNGAAKKPPVASPEPARSGSRGSGSGGSGAGRPGGPATPGAANKTPMPPPPRTVVGAVIALVVSAVGALIAGISLYGQGDWLFRELTKNDKKLKKDKQHTVQELHDKVSSTQKTALIGAIIVIVAVAILGYSVYRGRYWARWGVVGFWVLGTFSGTVIGINSLLAVSGDIPTAYKIPSFLAGLGFAVAVVLVNLGDSTRYFALTRPVRPAGAPQRRGLFAPRVPPQQAPAGRAPATNANREAAAERARTKKRANVATAESVAKGADLARTRAKAASKSRRTER